MGRQGRQLATSPQRPQAPTQPDACHRGFDGPVPGDIGYLGWLSERRDVLTRSEERESRLLHCALVRFVRPVASEEETLRDLYELLDAREVPGVFRLIGAEQLALPLDPRVADAAEGSEQ